MDITEGELTFRFPSGVNSEQLDRPGIGWPKGIAPVDFIVETETHLLLIEVKDPSASAVPMTERTSYIRRMQTKELTHNELVPKARGTYTFLHLMARDRKPMKFVVVLGTENLSVQPPLLLNLQDGIRRRLAQEMDLPWKRPYMIDCVVVSTADIGRVLQGLTVQRRPAPPRP